MLIRDSEFSDTPKKERKIYENYFKYGEKEGVLGGLTTVILTPYINSSEFKHLLTSRLLDSSFRAQVYSQYIYIMTSYEVCDWYEGHMKIAVDMLLGYQYKTIKENTSIRHEKILSPSPSSWVRNFSNSIMEGLRNDKWVPSYACVDYFITILPHALKEKFRKKVKLDVLYELIDAGLQADRFSNETKLFAEEMNAKKTEILEAWEIGERKIEALYE